MNKSLGDGLRYPRGLRSRRLSWDPILSRQWTLVLSARSFAGGMTSIGFFFYPITASNVRKYTANGYATCVGCSSRRRCRRFWKPRQNTSREERNQGEGQQEYVISSFSLVLSADFTNSTPWPSGIHAFLADLPAYPLETMSCLGSWTRVPRGTWGMCICCFLCSRITAHYLLACCPRSLGSSSARFRSKNHWFYWWRRQWYWIWGIQLASRKRWTSWYGI